MDTKITLSFDNDVIEAAKALAAEIGISLSRLTEILYLKVLETKRPVIIEELPISQWVQQIAEDGPVYITQKRSRQALKKAFFEKA